MSQGRSIMLDQILKYSNAVAANMLLNSCERNLTT